MGNTLPALAMLSAWGAGLVTGLLFIFSNTVMRALSSLPPEPAQAAMQVINRLIQNPLFLLLFLGTALCNAALAVACALRLGMPGCWLLLAGALLYLAGPLAVTLLRNVPLNNRLDAASSAQAHETWPRYCAAWLRWNHVRSALGALATALLLAGVYRLP
jgi:uncharacterized membrane protein